jgi:Uma2 family endonuclease
MLVDLEPPYLLIKPGVGEEEFYAMGEDSNWEYLDGRLVMSPASKRHEQIFRFLVFLLHAYLEERGGGEVLGSRYPMRLDERWSPEPDLLVVRDERRHLMGPKFLDGPADLVIEIASDGDPRFEAREKLPRYREARIPEIWLIDPFQRVLLVSRLNATTGAYDEARLAAGRIESAVVPGFWLEVDWLWQDRLPSTLACLQQILG